MGNVRRRLAVLMAAAVAISVAGCSGGEMASATTEVKTDSGQADKAAAEQPGDYSSWPEQDIKIIYYTKAGSGGDIFLRQLASALDGKLNGHKLLIENIVDPTGASAWSRVQSAEPDGYTLSCLSSTVVTADLIGGSPVKYEDFSYIAGLGMDPQYIYCRADAPYDTLTELVDYCRENPGKISWATSAPTSASTICSVALINEAGIDVNRVVYETGGDSLVAVLGKFVDVAVGEYGDMAPQIEAGELKLLTLLSENRNVLDVPTSVEQGYSFTFERPRGIAGPTGMDPALTARIKEVFDQAYESDAFNKYLESVAIDPVKQTGEEFLESYRAIATTVTENMDALTGQAK